MARTCFVLHSRGTPRGYANPFQQSCPPEPLGVQCSGSVTPAIDLALLYASVAAIIGGIATLGLLTFQWARAKNLGKGSLPGD